tara:strand:- start:307 stop:477 length:171 start_codon:yes stop_codon:yes gene_type:complete
MNNKFNVIASIVSSETYTDFNLLMEDEDFAALAKKVVHLSINEATEKLINKANEII